MKNTINEKDGVYTLMRNGQAAVCPYRQPIVLPGQLQGQVQIIPHPCNSQCPHFDLREIDGSECLYLHCADTTNFNIESDKPTNQAKIIL
jgi:hypothetical protein